MKLLVLVEDYPYKENNSLMYVHERNKYYRINNIDVTVVSFKAVTDYEYEGIKVITKKTYENLNQCYDILVCHAPNIRHHYIFLKKHEKNFKKIVFFFHGHEILKINEVYPTCYKFVKKKRLSSNCQNIYDMIKFFLWKKYLYKLLRKCHLIFVSKWLYDRFLYYIHINPKFLANHVSIINNSVGNIFERENYKYELKKEYDFITIRGDALDKSKYGIDLVTKLASLNDKFKFLVIGTGEFYKYNDKPKNLVFINKTLKHKEMISYLNKSRCALLLTKQDTQGVLTCEMATFGIPTITSNIEVCKEMFNCMNNVKLIDNDDEKIDLEKILYELEKNYHNEKCERFLAKNTTKKEIKIFENLINVK